RLSELLVDELQNATDHVSVEDDRLHEHRVVVQDPVPVGGERLLVGRVPCGERGHVVGGRISLKIEEDREIRFRDIPQADLDPSRNRLLYPNLASPLYDRSVTR